MEPTMKMGFHENVKYHTTEDALYVVSSGKQPTKFTEDM